MTTRSVFTCFTHQTLHTYSLVSGGHAYNPDKEPKVQRADTTCRPRKTFHPAHLMPLPRWRERVGGKSRDGRALPQIDRVTVLNCAQPRQRPQATPSSKGTQKIHRLERCLLKSSAAAAPRVSTQLAPPVSYPALEHSSDILSLCSPTEFQAPQAPCLLQDKQTRSYAKSWETKAENRTGVGNRAH